MAGINRWFLCSGFVVSMVLVGGCFSEPSKKNGDRSSNSGSQSSREKGVREAKEAIAAGKLKLKEYPPLPSPPGHNEYVRLLRERCGVEGEVPQLPPGVSERDFIQEVAGWNETMRAEIMRKFGNDIFDKLQEEGRKLWKEKVKPKNKD